MDSFVARQPIFDIDMNVYAYELLYRSNGTDNYFDMQGNMDLASAKVVMDSFGGMSLENLTGGKRAFINFTSNLIIHNAATLFPSQSLVIEVLETVPPTALLLDKLKRLRSMGYLIALDDFEYTYSNRALLALADIVKVDFMALDVARIKEVVSCVDIRRTRLLAEKVETPRDFEIAKSLGFTLFQGYFFAVPVIVSNRNIEPVKLNYMRLVRQVWQRGDLNYPQLARTIRQDTALSYKMLRLINSAYYARRREIKDIQHALVILGEVDIRKWVSLIAMAGYNVGRQDELMRESLIRARFMELYAAERRLTCHSAEMLFLSGLFSLLDVMLQQPMKEVADRLSMPAEVELALLHGECEATVLLGFLQHYERGDWASAARYYAALPQPGPDLTRLYLESINWCNTLMAA